MEMSAKLLLLTLFPLSGVCQRSFPPNEAYRLASSKLERDLQLFDTTLCELLSSALTSESEIVNGETVLSCDCTTFGDLLCTNSCDLCNADRTVCGRESFVIDLDETGRIVSTSERFNYRVGRSEAVVIQQSNCDPTTNVCGGCSVEVDGNDCNSCTITTCSNGIRGYEFQCNDFEPDFTFDTCSSHLIPAGSVFQFLDKQGGEFSTCYINGIAVGGTGSTGGFGGMGGMGGTTPPPTPNPTVIDTRDCPLAIGRGECASLLEKTTPVEGCDCYNYCNGEYRSCCRLGEPCSLSCDGGDPLVAGCSFEDLEMITLENACEITLANGTMIVVEENQPLGNLVTNECGSAEDYPCFCSSFESDGVRCPYCSYDTIDGDTVCAVDGGTATFVSPDGVNQTCTCDYQGNGIVFNNCQVNAATPPRVCALVREADQCDTVSATIDPIPGCDCYNFCAGAYSDCCKFGEDCATAICDVTDGIVAGCQIDPDRPPGGCWNSLNDIFEKESQLTDTSYERTYVLCPDTTFRVGTLSDIEDVEGGSFPILLRPNVHYKCGINGASRNGCVLLGGSIHVIATVNLRTGRPEVISNAILEGITFNGPSETIASLGSAGDITFFDCIFQNFVGVGAIVASLVEVETRRLRAQETMEGSFEQVLFKAHDAARSDLENLLGPSQRNLNSQRDLQMEAQSLLVTFKECQFLNNRGDSNGASGIFIGDDFVNVDVEHCIFDSNIYGFSTLAAGFAILSQGSVFVHDTCFVDNDFIGPGLALVIGGGTVSTSNNYGTDDAMLACEFLVKAGTLEALLLNSEGTPCVGFDADSCQAAFRSEQPTGAPSSAPTRSCPIEQNLENCDNLIVGTTPVAGCDCYNYCGNNYQGCCADDDFDCRISCSGVQAGDVITAGCRLSGSSSGGTLDTCNGVGTSCMGNGDCCSMRCIAGTCSRPIRPLGNAKLASKLSGTRGGAAGQFKGGSRRALKRTTTARIRGIKASRIPNQDVVYRTKQ